MPEHRFNEPYFELHLSELGPDAVHVFSFEGEEEISRLFEFRLLLLSEDPELDPESILNKPATLVLNVWDQNPVKIHGIISQFEQRGRTPAYVLYSAVLVPRMWRLTLNYQSAVYQNLPLDQVVDHLLREGGFSASDMDFKLNESYPTLEYAVQYRETDFDFINRRLEHFGVFYFFDDDDSKDIIVFGDSNQAFIPVDTAEAIYYDPNRDPLPGVQTINEFNSRARVVTGMIKLKEYNYRYPDRQLLAESQIDGSAPGVYYEFGEHFADDAEGEWLARIRNEEIHCQGLRFRGRSECRLLRPGRTFELAKHYREDWNREYVLLRVRHRGSQSAMFSRMMPHQEFTLTYENEFEALPVDMAYRPPRRTPIPRLPGIMFSRVESAAGDQYAYIDDQGRYHIRLPFDLSDNAQGEASRPVRLNQPYSGPNYGIHFPNHADTEMIWACISGNLDRPIALGTVPNPANMSPSTGNNKQQSVIRTAGQNELTFDDTAGKENIFLHGTKDWTIDIANDKKQTIGNNETSTVGNDRSREVGNNESISIGADRDKSVGGNQSETISGNKSITVGGNHTEQVGGNMSQQVGANKEETVAIAKMVTIGAAYQITVGAAMNETVAAIKAEEIGASKMVQVGANSSEDVGANKSVKAGQSISQEAGEDVVIRSGKKMALDAGDDFAISGGKKGAIAIKDELVIGCGKASITLKKNGDITIQGKKINIKASGDIVMKGKNIKEN